MSEYCPRDKCVWTSPDGKCHWPTYNCPWRVEKEAAAAHRQAIEAAQAEVKARERQRRQEEKQITKGLRETMYGGWEARITYKRKMYSLGIYRNKDDAIAVRQQAERHREQGDLLQWLKSGKNG